MSDPSRRSPLLSPALVAATCALYAGGALSRRWIDDDGFINLRIARNLLEGHGPVYNPGERVEAGTSPLWIGLLSLGGSLRIPLEVVAVYGGIALAVLGLFLAQRAALATEPERRTGSPWIPLPAGALAIAALPAFWDYGSSGLETGLTIAWMGGAALASARALDGSPRRARIAAAVAGLGPLVRPELALYSLAFAGPLAVIAWRADRPTRERARAVALLVACAAAAPLAWEVFRMGYYGTLTPNTALAKEAFLPNVRQGRCYLKNFFASTRMSWPLVPLAGLALFKSMRRERATGRVEAWAPFLPWLAAIAHGAYVVVMGGDYMYGRMWLPPVMAAALPAAVVSIRVSKKPDLATGAGMAFALGFLLWVPLSLAVFRPPKENQCGIGDERAWYAKLSAVPTPVRIADYAPHPFYKDGEASRRALAERCEGAGRPLGGGARCGVTIVDPADKEPGPTSQWEYATADAVSPEVVAVAPLRAIGIAGYLYEDTVHVVDRHGLTDPIGARLRLLHRGRPGHEKMLGNAWYLARFAAPASGDDAGVLAARRALDCGAARTLVRGTRAPLDAALFLANLRAAPAHHRLRVHPNPFTAEDELCGAPPRDVAWAGGPGGDETRWRCPPGARPIGVRAAWDPAADGGGAGHTGALAAVALVCKEVGTGTWRLGNALGRDDLLLETVACDGDQQLTGLRVRVDKWVRAISVECTGSGDPRRVVGEPAPDASVRCAGAIEGLVARTGKLVDAVGLECRR